MTEYTNNSESGQENNAPPMSAGAKPAETPQEVRGQIAGLAIIRHKVMTLYDELEVVEPSWVPKLLGTPDERNVWAEPMNRLNYAADDLLAAQDSLCADLCDAPREDRHVEDPHGEATTGPAAAPTATIKLCQPVPHEVLLKQVGTALAALPYDELADIAGVIVRHVVQLGRVPVRP